MKNPPRETRRKQRKLVFFKTQKTPHTAFVVRGCGVLNKGSTHGEKFPDSALRRLSQYQGIIPSPPNIIQGMMKPYHPTHPPTCP